ncbi:MAG: hypothetical protein U9O94_04880, partial [Nanoarchaeota archaeon]|nr:hypothetical protein [Nanoarchaeota archaeon]
MSQSIGEFDIPRYSKKIASLGNWNLNTHYKATFIRECLDKFGKNDLVYVDVDARFEKYPELFDNIVDDVAYWLNTYPNGARNELCSGTLFFKNNDKSREICDKWIDLCK